MTIRLAASWLADDAPLDKRLLPLLRAVAREGSLNRAVSSLRLSYRHAWGLLGIAERMLGQRLVTMERGRGARLSAFGEQLLEADEAASGVLARELASILQNLNLGASASRRTSREKPLVVHASHDLALVELGELMAFSTGGGIKLHFRGSLDSLADLARGECDMAGFHLPESSADKAAFDPYRPFLKTRNLRLVRFVHRQQGLMVPRGNPRQLLKLADLAEKQARFINRQPASGTRIAFDRLLAAARLQPEQINGYRSEEFTHAAVAATVASGMADAGFGIEAAARQQNLDFIPLVRERYLLAVNRSTLARAALQKMLQTLRGEEFQARCRKLPGYDASAAGEVIGAREMLSA